MGYFGVLLINFDYFLSHNGTALRLSEIIKTYYEASQKNSYKQNIFSFYN